jgi:UDP-N-acetylmuramate: L-alanyl-gamma-D-glutamyl-meso-diaminopimelate ligase
LSRSGVDAGWFVGAAAEGLEPAHFGSHDTFVFEGDEYPTGHDDTRPKFAHYHPHDALITAATHDHVNIYKTQEEFLKPFQDLVAALPEDGVLMLCADEPHAATLASHTKARVVTYSLSSASADWHASAVRREANPAGGNTTVFDLFHHGKKVATLTTHLIGEHNVQNIVGAAALLLEKRLLTAERIAAALPDFKGLARRLDKKTQQSRIPAYEGFGSSRDKLHAAIRAVRAEHPDERLVVVFEPHTFSWRNKNMLHWFDTAFEGADLVVLYKPAEQGAATHEQSTHEEMTERLAAHTAAHPAATPEEVMAFLGSEIRDGDVVLLSSSGPMDGLIEKIPLWLDRTFSS